jgi:hypothetical protein
MEMGCEGWTWRDLLMADRIVSGVLNQSSVVYDFPAIAIVCGPDIDLVRRVAGGGCCYSANLL